MNEMSLLINYLEKLVSRELRESEYGGEKIVKSVRGYIYHQEGKSKESRVDLPVGKRGNDGRLFTGLREKYFCNLFNVFSIYFFR